MKTWLDLKEQFMKGYRRTKMARARKAFRNAAGGQKSLPLYRASKPKIAASGLRNGGKRHSKDGAAG
jgi:hypothetical protein